MYASTAKATVRSVRAAERQVVKSELRIFEATRLPATSVPARSRTSSHAARSDSSDNGVPITTATAASPLQTGTAAGAARSARPEPMQRLLQEPFTGYVVHGERSALDEAQQVYDAVAWLRECPSSTLRQLQQRVLCATETLFTQLVGMPAEVRRLLVSAADPNARAPRSDACGDEPGVEPPADVYLTPPPSLPFTDFLSTFVRDTGTTAGTSLHGVLCSGRPQPAAPLSSLHLVYGLHVVEDALRPPSSSMPSTAAAASLESHPALMSEVVHWARFFEGTFDKAREGLCRDPVNFYVAVLLACAERGAWELHNTPDAIAEEAVRRLRLDDSTTGRRPHNCGACEAEATQLASRCRTYVHRTLQAMRYGEGAAAGTGTAHSRRGVAAASTRFFLATPAVVWWAAVFLRLYRLRTPVMAPTDTHASSTPPPQATADDVVSSAEVYYIRDWIARAAKQDVDGFKAQEVAGGFAVPLSCATRAPVVVFGFTYENVQKALGRLSELADAAVASGASVRVQHVLSLLQDDFPVVPYYLSYFKEE